MESLSAYMDFAVKTAWHAGQITMQHFQTDFEPEFKTDESPVTIADRMSETFIRERIHRMFPGHGMIGEEYGEDGAGRSHCWVIDPLDGTRAFVRGVPLYGVLIGLLVDGVCTVGVAHMPVLHETVWAASGQGCFYNGKPAQVSNTNSLTNALVSITDLQSFSKAGKEAAWQRLQKSVAHVRGWSDAYAYVLAATGRVDIVVDPLMAVWDCGPFPVIFEEAGGYFGNWKGEVSLTSNEALATNKHLLPNVIDLLNHA